MRGNLIQFTDLVKNLPTFWFRGKLVQTCVEMGKLTHRSHIHCLTLAERVKVIQEYDKNVSVRKLAAKYDCGESQIRNVIRRREGYLEEWKNNADPNLMRLHNSDRAITIQYIVIEWIKRRKSYDEPITDSQILSFGLQSARHMKITEHKASERWLARFKRKFNLDTPGGLDLKHDPEAVKKSLKLEDIIEDLKPKLEKQKAEEREKRVPGRIVSANSSISGDILDCVSLSDNDETNSDMEEVPADADDIASEDYEVMDEDQIYRSMGITRPEEKPITTYQEALKALGRIEEFALDQENLRAIGLINQIENIFKSEISKEEGS